MELPGTRAPARGLVDCFHVLQKKTLDLQDLQTGPKYEDEEEDCEARAKHECHLFLWLDKRGNLRQIAGVRAHGMWTYEPRQGRKAATAVCSASAVVTLTLSIYNFRHLPFTMDGFGFRLAAEIASHMPVVSPL